MGSKKIRIFVLVLNTSWVQYRPIMWCHKLLRFSACSIRYWEMGIGCVLTAKKNGDKGTTNEQKTMTHILTNCTTVKIRQEGIWRGDSFLPVKEFQSPFLVASFCWLLFFSFPGKNNSGMCLRLRLLSIQRETEGDSKSEFECKGHALAVKHFGDLKTECTMSPLCSRSCFKSNKLRPILNC